MQFDHMAVQRVILKILNSLKYDGSKDWYVFSIIGNSITSPICKCICFLQG